MADVVFPSAASWCEAEGTVTNSERRVQRVRKALEPPGEARDDMWIIAQLAKRLGHDWGDPTAEQVWDELRSLSPMHAGMSYARLEEHGGLQWPCPDEQHPGSPILHARLWAEPVEGPLAPFSVVENRPAVRRPGRRLSDSAHDRTAAGVVQHRRADERYNSPLHRGESLDLSPEDAERLELVDGEIVRVVVAPWIGRRPGADRPLAASGSGVHDVPFSGSRSTRTSSRSTPPIRSRARRSSRRLRSGSRSSSRRSRRCVGIQEPEPSSARARRREPMDIHLVLEPADRRPSAPRSTACSGRRSTAGREATAATGRPATPRSGGHEARARAAPAAAGAAGAAGANRLDQRRRPQLRLHASDVPPADAYGVATFYALLAVEPRPAARRPRLRGPRLPLPRLARI